MAYILIYVYLCVYLNILIYIQVDLLVANPHKYQDTWKYNFCLKLYTLFLPHNNKMKFNLQAFSRGQNISSLRLLTTIADIYSFFKNYGSRKIISRPAAGLHQFWATRSSGTWSWQIKTCWNSRHGIVSVRKWKLRNSIKSLWIYSEGKRCGVLSG